MDELAIKIEHVSKEYRLGAIGGGTLRGDLQTWWARKRGKEDPNAKIGARTDVKVGERFLALDDINIEVKKGEALGIIGHNGAGKSTLLKLLSRVTAPTSGTISYNGRIASMLEVGTGFHPELTGRENVYMNGAILGMTKKEIDAKMEEIIDFSEVRQFIDTPVKRYSSGMYVKLAFSVAAHLDSEIMIMDEVLAVGDMAFQKKCLTKMREAADKEGRTVLYVSHNMNTIRQLCDRCIVLDHGHVVFDGGVEEAIGLYIGTNSEMELPVTYDFTNSKRNHHFGRQVFTRSFRFVDAEVARFMRGQIIKTEIVLDSTINVNDARIILRIKDSSNYVRYAGILTNCFVITQEKGQHIQLSLDTKPLIADEYCLSFEVISTDALGNYHSYDNPGAAINISIYENDNPDIYWAKQYWGNVRLADTEAIRTQ